MLCVSPKSEKGLDAAREGKQEVDQITQMEN